ncbi:hypothetical protein ACFY1L_44575 [Streptomyces sp. NPDC001663]
MRVVGAPTTTSPGFLHGMRIGLTISIVLLVVVAAATPVLEPATSK